MMRSKSPINPQDYKAAILFFGITAILAIALSVWKIGAAVAQF